MSGPPLRRALEGVVRDLVAPLLEPPPAGAGWRLLGLDGEQGLCLVFEVDGRALLVELEDRDDQHGCFDRTGRFNVYARRPFDPGGRLSERERALVQRVVRVVGQREARLADFERPSTGRRRSVRRILVDQALVPEGCDHYYLNPYCGCMIGCPYCYVLDRADLSRRLEGLPRMPWGHWVDVKVNLPEILEKEVQTRPPGIVRMSPIVTDPYQPVERRYRITRRCLEVLRGTGFVPAVLTRAARIHEDLELIAGFERALVGFSIPSDDDRMRAVFEPGADPIADRLEALAAFRRRGVTTVAVIQPLLPMDPDALAERLAPLVSAVRIDRMYALDLVRPLYREHGLEHTCSQEWFAEAIPRLERAFAERGVAVAALDDLRPLLAAPAHGC
jgi:DNA repair photolyase